VRDAAVQAVEAVDLALGRLMPVIARLGGAMIVTADHGNADQMYELDKKGMPKLDDAGKPQVKTAHTLNPVPMLVYAPSAKLTIDESVRDPGLANVAGTVLHLLGLRAPEDYGRSLIRGR
jgi:2,3-bisphosphoglycerate-independent phosphoglycerate mutase